MKKYFLLFSLTLGIVLFLFISLGTQQKAYACTSNKDCSGNQICQENNPQECQICKNAQQCQSACTKVCKTPTLQEGDKCDAKTASECVGGTSCKQLDPLPSQCNSPQCAKDPQCIATCDQKYCEANNHPLGSTCTGKGAGNCDAGLVCQNGICKASTNGSCASSDVCATGLVCQGGLCKVKPGGSCQTGQCAAGSSCLKGKCEATGGVCTQTTKCPSGEQCVGLGTPFECMHDSIGCTGTCQAVSTSPSTSSAPPLPPPPSPPCIQWNGGKCMSVDTALGHFATDPTGFVKTIFDILLSVSGGIALLLIIKSGYQLMTSQGKPEQVQNGRDQLVAAIVGLAFLIFSFVVLQVIGFDILHIPGFGQ